jgi:hypothetical protein
MLPVVAFKEFRQVSAAMVIPQVPVLTPLLLNLQGEGLKIDWNITRSRGSTPDTGEVTVYNLSAASRGLLDTYQRLSSSGVGLPMNLSLSLGWGGLVGQVMFGQVWKLLADQRVGEDVMTTFYVGDGGISARDAVVGQSFAQSSIQTIVTFLVLYGLKVPLDPASLTLVTQKSATIPIAQWKNYVVTNSVETALDDLLDTIGLEWKIVDGIWIVTDQGNAATASPIAYILSAQSGLLDWTSEDGGVTVSALANPNIMPGSAIQVIDSFGKPVGSTPQLRVETIQFTGTTDGESLMTIQARPSALIGGLV